MKSSSDLSWSASLRKAANLTTPIRLRSCLPCTRISDHPRDHLHHDHLPALLPPSSTNTTTTAPSTTTSNTTTNTPFITLFRPDIPMTPNIARHHGAFVVDGFFFDSIRPAAYAVARHQSHPRIPCVAVLNELFIPTGHTHPLMYLGFLYPDGTSLSYIPIRDVILQHRTMTNHGNINNNNNYNNNINISTHDTDTLSLDKHHSQPYPTRSRPRPYPRPRPYRPRPYQPPSPSSEPVYGRDYVYLSIPADVYYVLVHMAEDVLSQADAEAKPQLPDVQVRSDRVWLFNTQMKQSCKVEGFANGRRYAKTVEQTMNDTAGNLQGDALLFLRFSTDPPPNDHHHKLQFRLHRMLVKTVSRF